LEEDAVAEEGEKEIAVLSSLDESLKEESKIDNLTFYDNDTLLVKSNPNYYKPQVLASIEKETESVQRIWARVTAYAPLDPNAVEGMCYSGDPLVTASGTRARDGVVAANFLKFGTKIKIPALFGDKIFTVEDRMSSKYQNTVDVLVSSKDEAIRLGVKKAYIEIVK
jgi:3D (Asp-Asp-Asp) domain-containing protein